MPYTEQLVVTHFRPLASRLAWWTVSWNLYRIETPPTHVPLMRRFVTRLTGGRSPAVSVQAAHQSQPVAA